MNGVVGLVGGGDDPTHSIRREGEDPRRATLVQHQGSGEVRREVGLAAQCLVDQGPAGDDVHAAVADAGQRSLGAQPRKQGVGVGDGVGTEQGIEGAGKRRRAHWSHPSDRARHSGLRQYIASARRPAHAAAPPGISFGGSGAAGFPDPGVEPRLKR